MPAGLNSSGSNTLKLPGLAPQTQSVGSQTAALLKQNAGPGSTGQQSSIPSSPPKASTGLKSIFPSGTPSTAGVGPSKAAPRPVARPSTYGLDTTSTKPYNALAPETTGQVNQAILAAAKQQFEPQLQGVQGGINAEDVANKERSQELGGIYGTYNDQAAKAYQDTRDALTQLLSQNASGNAQAEQTLGAALGSANQPGNSLAQMMGVTEPAGSSATPYNLAALGGDNAGQNELSSIAAGLLGTAGTERANAGLEQAQQTNNESLRHQGALEGFQSQRQAINQQIGPDIQVARTAEQKALQDAATTALQNRLATATFDLGANKQAFDQNLATMSFAEKQQKDAATNAQGWERLKEGQQRLGQQEQSIQASIDSTNVKTLETEAKLSAQQANNVSKTVQAYFLPTKEEITTQTKTDPKSGATVHSTQINHGAYLARINPSELVNELTNSYGITEAQALQSLTGITVKYGTAPGPTVGQWAQGKLAILGTTGKSGGPAQSSGKPLSGKA